MCNNVSFSKKGLHRAIPFKRNILKFQLPYLFDSLFSLAFTFGFTFEIAGDLIISPGADVTISPPGGHDAQGMRAGPPFR